MSAKNAPERRSQQFIGLLVDFVAAAIVIGVGVLLLTGVERSFGTMMHPMSILVGMVWVGLILIGRHTTNAIHRELGSR